MPRRHDHDRPWKIVLEAYFPDCLGFFFPDLYQAIDWNHPYEFLDKELQQVRSVMRPWGVALLTS